MNVADQLSLVNENFLSCVLYVSTLWLTPNTQRPESQGLGQDFEGGAGSMCRRKTPGFLSAHAFFCTGYRAHHVKTSQLDPAPAPAQHGLPVQNGEIFILSKSLGVATFALRGSPTRLILTNF